MDRFGFQVDLMCGIIMPAYTLVHFPIYPFPACYKMGKRDKILFSTDKWQGDQRFGATFPSNFNLLSNMEARCQITYLDTGLE